MIIRRAASWRGFLSLLTPHTLCSQSFLYCRSIRSIPCNHPLPYYYLLGTFERVSRGLGVVRATMGLPQRPVSLSKILLFAEECDRVFGWNTSVVFWEKNTAEDQRSRSWAAIRPGGRSNCNSLSFPCVFCAHHTASHRVMATIDLKLLQLEGSVFFGGRGCTSGRNLVIPRRSPNSTLYPSPSTSFPLSRFRSTHRHIQLISTPILQASLPRSLRPLPRARRPSQTRARQQRPVEPSAPPHILQSTFRRTICLQPCLPRPGRSPVSWGSKIRCACSSAWTWSGSATWRG